MLDKNVHMPKLPEQVKRLVNQGIYSLYRVTGHGDKRVAFALVTSPQVVYLLSDAGEVISEGAKLDGLKLGRPVAFPELPTEQGPKLNISAVG